MRAIQFNKSPGVKFGANSTLGRMGFASVLLPTGFASMLPTTAQFDEAADPQSTMPIGAQLTSGRAGDDLSVPSDVSAVLRARH